MTDDMAKLGQEKPFQVFKQILLNNINQSNSIYYELQKLSKELTESITMLKNIENAVPGVEEYETIFRDDIDSQYVNLISPQMHQKIVAYYNKHKNRVYSSKYKIDKKIHNMLISMGKYLEKVNYDLSNIKHKKLEVEKRYYSLISDLSSQMNEYLALLSNTLRKIAIKLGILGASFFYGLSFMSAYSPELLVWLKFVFVFNRLNDILIITSYAISPNKNEEMKKIKHRIIEVLGIYKNKFYSLYIKFVYKLYDILNAIMSFIKNLDVYLRGSRDWREFYEKLENHMLMTTGISYEWLVDIVSFDLVTVDEFIRGLRNYKELNTYRYRIRVSPNAISKLRQHYGRELRIDGSWINVTLSYLGGRYYMPANPLDTKLILDVSGFDGILEEKASFVMAVILLADEMTLDNIYTTSSLSLNSIISIDLNRLKWLIYKDKSWIARLIDRILGRDRKYLSSETISNKLFESYIMMRKVNNS